MSSRCIFKKKALKIALKNYRIKWLLFIEVANALTGAVSKLSEEQEHSLLIHRKVKFLSNTLYGWEWEWVGIRLS